MLTRFSIPVALVLATATVAPLAEAAVEPIAQRRLAIVFATASNVEEVSHDSDQVEAIGFDVFDDAVMITQSVPGTSATSAASHTSEIDDTSFAFFGEFSASAVSDIPEGSSEAFGQAVFEYDFLVTTPTTMLITGLLEVDDRGHSAINVIGPDISFLVNQPNPGSTVVYETFQLAAGNTYRVVGHTNGFGQAFGDDVTPGAGRIHFDGSFSTPVAVPGADHTSVLSAYPNPTRGSVTFDLVSEAATGVSIFDAAGRLVRSLNSDTARLNWDGRTTAGERVSPGVYFYRAAGTADAVERLVVIQ